MDLDRLRAALAPEYELVRFVARGGMGAVYLCRDTRLDRPVAVKVLPVDTSSAVAVRRFLDEGRHLAKVRSRHVVAVHDAREQLGFACLVMDYVEGPTLEQRLREGPLAAGETVELARGLLDGLSTVHRSGLLHRDLKPSNIFVDGGEALLADFGIARDTERGGATLTEPGGIVGTPAYMAPEQLAGLPATARSDVYAAGAILYEACTGRRWEHRPDPERAEWRGVPPALRPALAGALRFDADDRWPTAAAFAKALEHGGRRRPGLVAAVVAAGSVAAAGLLAAGWLRAGSPWPPWERVRAPAAAPAQFAVLPFDAGDSAALGRALAERAGQRLEWYPRWTMTPTVAAAAWWDTMAVHSREATAGAALRVGYTVQGRLAVRGTDVEVELAVRDSTGHLVDATAVPRLRRDASDWAGAVSDSIVRILFPADYSTWLELMSQRGNKEAYRELFQGDSLFQLDEWTRALEHYDRALALDPRLVQAAWQRTLVLRWQRRPFEAELRRLLDAQRDRLPDFYQRLIEAQLEPDLRARLERYRAVREAYPRRSVATLLLFDELFHRGPLIGHPLTEALALARDAVAHDPTLYQATTFDHYVWGYTHVGARREAKDGVVRRLALTRDTPDDEESASRAAFCRVAYWGRFHPRFAAIAIALTLWRPGPGRIEELNKVARTDLSFDIPEVGVALGRRVAAAAIAPRLRASGLAGQGLALVALGRPEAGLARLDSAMALFATEEAALQRAEWRVVPGALGLVRIDSGLVASGRRDLAAYAAGRGAAAARATWALALDAWARGDSAAAAGWAGAFGRAAGDDADSRRLAAVLRAMLAAARGAPDTALLLSDSLVATADAGTLGGPFARPALYLHRAAWAGRLGRLDDAERTLLWYENSDLDGWPRDEPTGGEVDGVASVFARLLRAENALARGDGASACALGRRVRELWDDAEPAMAPLVQRAERLVRGCAES
jgi:serine/threonine-protein kinase